MESHSEKRGMRERGEVRGRVTNGSERERCEREGHKREGHCIGAGTLCLAFGARERWVSHYHAVTLSHRHSGTPSRIGARDSVMALLHHRREVSVENKEKKSYPSSVVEAENLYFITVVLATGVPNKTEVTVSFLYNFLLFAG